MTLKNDDHLHSQPPADYGWGAALNAGIPTERATLHPEPGGWQLLVISDFELPGGFQPARVDLLVKLPPGFPDAAPDMFWICPAAHTASGNVPRSTMSERLLGRNWRRFSWHLAAGAWKPGVSELRDFLRCIRARFLRMD